MKYKFVFIVGSTVCPYDNPVLAVMAKQAPWWLFICNESAIPNVIWSVYLQLCRTDHISTNKCWKNACSQSHGNVHTHTHTRTHTRARTHTHTEPGICLFRQFQLHFNGNVCILDSNLPQLTITCSIGNMSLLSRHRTIEEPLPAPMMTYFNDA